MRQIKFRGFSKELRKFVYGDLLHLEKDFEKYNAIIDWSQKEAKVNVETDSVGQFTDLRDKNGNDIYEGDILRVNNAELIDTVAENGYWKEVYGDVTGPVIYEDGAFHYTGHSSGPLPLWTNDNEYEVIGNIYEHPHLLNQEK